MQSRRWTTRALRCASLSKTASSCGHADPCLLHKRHRVTTGADKLTLITQLVHGRKHSLRLQGWRVKLDTPDAAVTSRDASDHPRRDNGI
jgi:hypothetical protein